jgi:hypothetical protein
MPWLMLWAVSCQPLSAEAQLQAQAFTVRFLVVRVAMGQGFLSVLWFTWLCNSTNSTYLSICLSLMLYNLCSIK